MEQLKDKWAKAGQQHVFDFYPSLSVSDQQTLVDSLNKIDVERVNRIFTTSTKVKDEKFSVTPLPDAAFDSIIGNKEDLERWSEGSFNLT